MTIHDRLDSISSGITPEDLIRYERESTTFAHLIKKTLNKNSSYTTSDDVISWLDEWHDANSYRVSSDDIIVKKLQDLGVIVTPIQIKPAAIEAVTPLGSYLVELKSAFVNEDFANFAGMGPDSDGDISRSQLNSALRGVKAQMDIFYILDGLVSDEVNVDENPSPPMRIKLGIK